MSDKTWNKILAVVIPLPIFVMAILDVCWYHRGTQSFETTIVTMFMSLMAYVYFMTAIALIMLFRGEE